MRKDLIFFAQSGLTTTSANHIANIAKEAYRGLEQTLLMISFINTDIGLISADTNKRISTGINISELQQVESQLEKIAQYKSLIAWLREAIKAKQRLIQEATNMSNKDIADILDITIPKEPTKDEVPSEDDIIATLSIKERNRIYHLDTLCSQIGSFIHPDGTFSKNREKLNKKLSSPYEVDGIGTNTTIKHHTPSVHIDDVDNVYFSLQKKYRAYQAELNSHKYKIETAIQQANAAANSKYAAELETWTNQCNTILAKIKEYRDSKIAAAQSLKIIIPDSLQGIYTEISNIGQV